MAQPNNRQRYRPVPPSSYTTPKKKIKQTQDVKQSNTYNLNSGMTNQFHVQRDLQTIGIYDHEWDALKKIVTKIKDGCSKVNLSGIIDGFGAGISIPFCLDMYKIITSSAPSSDLKNETLFYFVCFIIFLVLEFIKFVIKPKWISSYSSLHPDVENLNERFNEIDKRLGIKKEE